MDGIQLLLLSVLLYGVGAVLSLLLNNSKQSARYVSGIAGMIASLVGCAAAVLVFAGKPTMLEMPGIAPFGHFTFQLDGLSALMVGMISLLAFASSLFSISYVEVYADRSLGVMGFFNNLFIGVMLLVVTVANAFYFLIFWELMTLASYFLVIFEQEKEESVSAGYIYFLIAHAGTALIMLAFFVLYQNAGSFDFIAFRNATLSPTSKSLVFLLAFLGFGAKAGMVPLHFWLPRAHPAAPSHVSALLSGVMIKTGIYGIIRICVDVLGVPFWWWGFMVLVVGIITAVLGIAYALAEHDIKRLLAYCSVESIGIILVGIGAGMVGMATGQPVLALVGLLAALFHTFNHAVFKGLLFLGAGSVIYRVRTNNMDEMGGLVRWMPWTGLTFLIGAISISSIPPLNGFVSEWFIYQSLFIASHTSVAALRVFAPIFFILLAAASTMTGMCWVKAYGATFTGPARSTNAREVKEAPAPMLIGMAILAISCILLGVGSPAVIPYLGRVAASIANVPLAQMVSGVQVFPVDVSQAVLSPPMILLLLGALLVVPLLLVVLYGGFRAGRRRSAEPWACGYGYSSQMAVSASNFAQPMRVAFQALYLLRPLAQVPLDAIALSSKKARGVISDIEPLVERMVSRPTRFVVEYLADHIQKMQMGDIRVYCLYIVLTLAILLIVAFR